MLLYLCCLLLAGCPCHRCADDFGVVHVLQDTVAELPCPHKEGQVSWSRLIGSKKVTLVSTKNGKAKRTNEHYDSWENNSLVIVNVKPSDSAMYWCNDSKIYLNVSSDPKAKDAPLTPRNGGLGFGPDPGQGGAADTEDQQSSDFWKIPVGVVVGAALMLSAVLTLRFCSKKKEETNTGVDKPVTEVIYEEIEGVEQQPGTESDVESPYWTGISDTRTPPHLYSTVHEPSSDTRTPPHLYSTVNKQGRAGRGGEDCVYYLAQSPAQTGDLRSQRQ